MVEKEVVRRVFRVTAKVVSIDYTKMTLDYAPVDGTRNKPYDLNYCRINNKQADMLYHALTRERHVKLLIEHKVKIDEKKTTIDVLDKWYELVEAKEIWH